LLAGAFHSVLNKYGLDIVNRDSIMIDEILAFLQQNQLSYEQIVITDDALINKDVYSISAILKNLLLLHEKENEKKPLLLVTSNVLLQDLNIPGVEVCYYYTIRVTISQYQNIIRRTDIIGATPAGKRRIKIKDKKSAEKQPQMPEKETADIKPKKSGLLDRLRKDKASFSPETSYAEKEFASISSEISRVIAITGCRGSGVTSTAVNLAHLASKKGLSTMLVDLDVVNCALNLYFSDFFEMAEKDNDIACSLIRNLAKPQDYKLNTYNQDSLYMTTLSYSFRDKELLERFYTAAKLVNMLSVFRKHFQLCLLDMPLEALGKFTESILFIDDFGLCIPNNLYSITGALRAMQNLFNNEDMESLRSKSKIIVSKYNDQATLQDEFFSAEKVCELLLELGSAAYYESGFELAGAIPYIMDFDSQLETDIPIADNNSHMEKAYTDIFLRMIKGVR